MDTNLLDHKDALSVLNSRCPLKEKLTKVHTAIKDSLPFVARISVALYDHETRMLKTFLESNDQSIQLSNFEASVDESKTLSRMMDEAMPRVTNNLYDISGNHMKEHTKRILNAGYAASYTKPFFNHDMFMGFLFFNANQTDVFDKRALSKLDIYGHIISLLIITELAMIKTMAAAMKTSGRLTQLRDPETGSHLDRMSRYSRLIAKNVAKKHNLSDEYIERVFKFSPLHDIGKIAIPDHILMKPDKLDVKEMEIMKTHAVIGRKIIDEIIDDFCLGNLNDIDIVRHIVESHHEMLDGSGYPHGLMDEQIPFEAKIVAVADIFDALTSRRPYKEAWSNQDAFELLKELAGKKLDQDCVNALLENVDKVEEIQRLFKEEDVWSELKRPNSEKSP